MNETNTINQPKATLLAHCGTRKITRDELLEIPTPSGTRTHQPLSHSEVVAALTESLAFRLLKVVRDEYAVSQDGMKMFGVMDLNSDFDGCRFSIGLRNSNDKSMRLALTAGVRVTVCDNMAFSGDFNPLFHKHTRNLELRDSITLAVDRIHRNFLPLQANIAQMKTRRLNDETVKLLIYEAFVDRGLRGVPKHLLSAVHEHYFAPKYEEFAARTLWSLSNAFTSAFKELAPLKQFELTARLGAYLADWQTRQDIQMSPNPADTPDMMENRLLLPAPSLAADSNDHTFGDHHFNDDDFDHVGEIDDNFQDDDFREQLDYEDQELIDELDERDADGEQSKDIFRRAA